MAVRKSDLVNWYPQEMENQIETEAELILMKILNEKVIHRLAHVISVADYSQF